MSIKPGGRENRAFPQKLRDLRDEMYGSIVTVIKPDGTRYHEPATYYEKGGHIRRDMKQYFEDRNFSTDGC
jgi:hypothetical protein